MWLPIIALLVVSTVARPQPPDKVDDKLEWSAAPSSPASAVAPQPSSGRSRAKACPAKKPKPKPGSDNGGSGSGWGSQGSGAHPSAWWQGTPVFDSPPAETATLAPGRHWGIDGSDSQHLKPAGKNKLYFSPGGNGSPDTEHQMAWLDAEFLAGTVLLDNSDLCKYEFDASSSTLSIKFDGKQAFELAKSLWATNTLFVLNSNKCNTGANCYLRANEAKFIDDGLECDVSAKILEFHDAVGFFDLEWGRWSPNGGGKNGWKPTTTTWITSTATSTATSAPAATTSGAAGSWTVGGSSNNVNCTPPTDTKYGLKTACLGEWFDEDLDLQYGLQKYQQSSFYSFMSQFQNIIWTDPIPSTNNYATTNQAVGLSKRFSLIPQVLKDAVAKVLPITGVTTPYTKEVNLLSFSLMAPRQVQTMDSPFGPAVLLGSFARENKTNPNTFAKLDIFCVNCGLMGSADITGRISVSVVQGIQSLAADFRADMSAVLQIGVDVEVQLQQQFSKMLYEVPLSPISIPDIITIGPELKIGADLTLTANANGQVLAGASVTIQNAKATVDIAQFSASGTGWQPQYNYRFDANGEIKLDAVVGLPIALAVGVDILNGKYQYQAALVDEPKFEAQASLQVQAGGGNGVQVNGGIVPQNGCGGIAVQLDVLNSVYVQIPNKDPIILSNPPPFTLASGCIGRNVPQKRDAFPQLEPRQSDNGTLGPVVDYTAQTMANSTITTTTWTLPPSGSASWNTSTGWEVAILTDSEVRHQLFTCLGSLYVFPVNATVDESQVRPSHTFKQSSILLETVDELEASLPLPILERC